MARSVFGTTIRIRETQAATAPRMAGLTCVASKLFVAHETSKIGKILLSLSNCFEEDKLGMFILGIFDEGLDDLKNPFELCFSSFSGALLLPVAPASKFIADAPGVIASSPSPGSCRRSLGRLSWLREATAVMSPSSTSGSATLRGGVASLLVSNDIRTQ